MNNARKFVDGWLNKLTMYRVVLYGLLALLVVADIFAFTGLISISGTGLLISALLLCVTCYVTNYAFGTLVRGALNSESWLITALILACILPQSTTLSKALYVVLAGVIAMASKYVLVYRRSHIFNPAAVAAFVLSVTGLLPATWWIATPLLAPFTILLALAILRKQRKFSLFFAFAAAALAMSLYVGVGLHSQMLGTVLHNALLSLPLIFMGSVMLTEPTTLPARRYYQVLLGILVGAVYASQLHYGSLTATPEAALIVAGLFAFAVAPAFGAVLRLQRITQLNANTYDLAFEKPGRGFSFTPGQYLEWTLPHKRADMRGNRRMFSIASSPSEPELHIGIKTYEPSSTFKQALIGLKEGKYIRAAHVAGGFTLPDDASKPIVLIAGGIGITPFRSMLKQLTDAKETRTITLLYTARSEEDFVYREDLQAAETIGLKTQYVVGRIEAETLQKGLPQLKRSQVYISGPDAMVSGYAHMLARLGVARSHIKTDHFTGY